MTNRSSFAYTDGSSRGTLVRPEAQPEQSLTLARVESLLARAESARDAEMNELRRQMLIMQQKSQLQIETSVKTAMDSAFNSDGFAERLVRAMHIANQAMQNASLCSARASGCTGNTAASEGE